uniref:hypothetical protein n=1 Tax=uncultured Nostoc sp. TaxID=340711 RepID=UPI0035CA1057
IISIPKSPDHTINISEENQASFIFFRLRKVINLIAFFSGGLFFLRLIDWEEIFIRITHSSLEVSTFFLNKLDFNALLSSNFYLILCSILSIIIYGSFLQLGSASHIEVTYYIKLKNLLATGQYLFCLALGGSFFGGLIASITGSIVGAIGGGVFGLISVNINNPNIWRQGRNVITSALGGALLGGLIGHLPGSICGAVIGGIFSVFTQI